MKRDSNSRALIVAVVATAVIHVAVAAMLVMPAVVRFFKPRPPKVVEEVARDEKLVFKFQAMSKKPIVKPVPKPTPDVAKKVEAERKRFVRTSSDQAQGAPKETNRIGDRNTVARSDAKARADAPDQAAIRGEKRESDESTNSNQQLGDLDSEAVARKAVPAVQPKSLIPPPPEDIVEPKRESVPKVAKGAEKKDFVEMDEKVEVGKSAKERSDRVARGEDLKLKKEAEERLERELAQKEAERRKREVEEKAEAERQRMAAIARRKAGFKPTVRAAESMGSIAASGKASQNVAATPTGRYMSEVIKRVGKEWYKRCGERRDLLLPGSLTMGWFVYEDGSIDHLEIKGERNGGDIQKGITIQSIKAARNPVMPKAVRDELNGDPLYIQINFEF